MPSARTGPEPVHRARARSRCGARPAHRTSPGRGRVHAFAAPAPTHAGPHQTLAQLPLPDRAGSHGVLCCGRGCGRTRRHRAGPRLLRRVRPACLTAMLVPVPGSTRASPRWPRPGLPGALSADPTDPSSFLRSVKAPLNMIHSILHSSLASSLHRPLAQRPKARPRRSRAPSAPPPPTSTPPLALGKAWGLGAGVSTRGRGAGPRARGGCRRRRRG